MAHIASEPDTQLTARRFSSPQEEALLTLIRSADCLQRDFQLRLRPFGLTATQYNVLRILRAANPSGLTCAAIGRSMLTPEPDITRLLARLKANGLVRQRRDTHDRRVLWTCITDPGLEILRNLDGIVERAPREMLGTLNCDEVSTLIRLLGKAQCCRPSSVSVELSPAKEKGPESGPHLEDQLENPKPTAKRPSLPPARFPRRPE
jgi:DNA-binding MarR family transcriptional regulator